MSEFYLRNLPHWQPPGSIIFVTFRIAGSLPKAVELKLVNDARLLKESFKTVAGDSPELVLAWKKLFKYADDKLNASDLCLHLRDPKLAAIVVDSIHKGADLQHYILHRYCVMPNHAHMLIEPLPENCAHSITEPVGHWPPLFYTSEGRQQLCGSNDPHVLKWRPVCQILKSLKGITAYRINKLLGGSGPFWSQESYDHWIRNDGEYNRVVTYIDENPVKARLCTLPCEWQWSSAYEVSRF